MDKLIADKGLPEQQQNDNFCLFASCEAELLQNLYAYVARVKQKRLNGR